MLLIYMENIWFPSTVTSFKNHAIYQAQCASQKMKHFRYKHIDTTASEWGLVKFVVNSGEAKLTEKMRRSTHDVP